MFLFQPKALCTHGEKETKVCLLDNILLGHVDIPKKTSPLQQELSHKILSSSTFAFFFSQVNLVLVTTRATPLHGRLGYHSVPLLQLLCAVVRIALCLSQALGSYSPADPTGVVDNNIMNTVAIIIVGIGDRFST